MHSERQRTAAQPDAQAAHLLSRGAMPVPGLQDLAVGLTAMRSRLIYVMLLEVSSMLL